MDNSMLSSNLQQEDTNLSIKKPNMVFPATQEQDEEYENSEESEEEFGENFINFEEESYS